MKVEISSHLKENRHFKPDLEFSKHALCQSEEQYNNLYQQSINDPEKFWAEQANENLEWFKKWDKVLDYNFQTIGEIEAPYLQFFQGAKLNISHNCLDRHLKTSTKNKKAIIWQGEKEEDKRVLTYQ
ncbi:MAG: acetyl-coenzyme A synthetase, partial [Proteobacteria bacterium]|nr:acetyl-coenzyme A synthetase [Pseudomonadota bacterium]